MGENARVRETVRLFSNLWQLPSLRGILLRLSLIVLVGMTLPAIMRVVKSPDLHLSAVFTQYGALLFMSVIVSIPLIYGIIREHGSPLDIRRTTGAIQFSTLILVSIGICGSLLGLLLNSPSAEIRAWSVGVFAAYLMLTFLVTALSSHRSSRIFVAVSTPVLLWLLTLIIISTAVPALFPPILTWPVVYVGSLIGCWVAVRQIFRSVSRPFERDLGINGPELLRAFGYDYLVDDPSRFNTLMTRIASVEDIPIGVLILRSGTALVAVGVILYVHPGPFKNSGSSTIPSVIIRHVQERYGVPAFVMHGTCTHHQNLTTSEDFSRVFAEMDRLIESTRCVQTMSGPHFTANEQLRVWTMLIDSGAIVITSPAPDLIDDIALAVGNEAAEAIRAQVPMIRDVIVVDAHNSLGEDVASLMPGDRLVPVYVSAVTEAVKAASNRSAMPVEAGVARVHPPEITTRDGLGPGGVTALVLKSSDAESVFISIDGNNALPDFRDTVVQLLQQEGFNQVELLTTDTHIVNAVSLSRKGYAPVGQLKRDAFLNAVRSAALEARARCQSVHVGVNYGIIKGLRTFGEKGFDVLTHDIVEAVHAAKHMGPRLAALAMLLTVLLHLLP